MHDPILKRAQTYPYPAPEGPYLFKAGRAQTLPANMSMAGRLPFLAIGSNRSPEQLARKYGKGDKVEIPVTPLWLAGYDVVFSCYMTSYGSLPATLIEAPGVQVCVSITWLTRPQIEIMHTTESVGKHTQYGVLSGLSIDAEYPTPSILRVYISHLGIFALENTPIPLTALKALGRSQPSLTELEVLHLVHQRFGASSFESWLLKMIEDRQARLTLNHALQEYRYDKPLKAFSVLSEQE